MDKYIDPDNIEEIKQQLTEKRTLKDVLDFIDVIFPGWVVTFADKYSDKYPGLTENWKKTCEKIESKPTQIMIVDQVDFTEGHKLAEVFGDLFTRMGFSVRSKDHFVPCGKCGSSYPTLAMHTLLKEAKEVVPENWGCC